MAGFLSATGAEVEMGIDGMGVEGLWAEEQREMELARRDYKVTGRSWV